MSERRPIEAHERPHLKALGVQVRALRDDACMTQAGLGVLAGVSSTHVSSIERGKRRTRRSTLARMVAVMVPESSRDVVLGELVEVAGVALAPESVYAERVARRRESRQRGSLDRAADAAAETLTALRRQARYARGERLDQLEEMVAGFEQLVADLAQQRDARMTSTQRAERWQASRGPAWNAWQAALGELHRRRQAGERFVQFAGDPPHPLAARCDELKRLADIEEAERAHADE